MPDHPNPRDSCSQQSTDGQDDHPPMRVGQFRISTLLSWTLVVCFLAACTRYDNFLQVVDGDLTTPGFWRPVLFFAFIYVTPFTCVPFLIDRLLMNRNALEFGLFWRYWLSVCVGVYSMLMLMLATVAFDASWKGSKGLHWFFYSLDQLAGMTLWPIYGIGVMLFINMLFDPQKASRNIFLLFGPATCAAISFWYVLATTSLNFTGNGSRGVIMAIIPGGAGICYALYCGIVIRNREFSLADFRDRWWSISSWIAFLVMSVGIKIPLAKKIYEDLPDEMPEDCFIVTAASRGHPLIVGSWVGQDNKRILNRQLLVFWSFEDWLRARHPVFQQLLRQIYNWIGPRISRYILFRWQADLVYLALKPAELCLRFCTWINRMIS